MSDKRTNKIKYGLKNVHYAIVTETTVDGKTTSSYGEVKPWAGAVSMSLDPLGEPSNFYADDSVYAVLRSNNGYEGDFESALVPEEILTSVLGQETVDGVLVEAQEAEQKYIALLFEFDGDAKARRHVLYRCTITRPGMSSQTKEDSTEPATDSVTITATPRPDVTIINGNERHLTKATTGTDTPDEVYAAWYQKVWVPTEPEAVG